MAPINIANEADVKKREEEFKTKKKLESAQLGLLMQQKPFRDFVWRTLGRTGVFAPQLWEQSAKIHCNAAVRDLGMDLWVELEVANQEAVFQMMRENKKEEKSND